jgi:hypothetical protein
MLPVETRYLKGSAEMTTEEAVSHLLETIAKNARDDKPGALERACTALEKLCTALQKIIVPVNTSNNTQSAVITQICAEMETVATHIESIDPNEIATDIQEWRRKLRAL